MKHVLEAFAKEFLCRPKCLIVWISNRLDFVGVMSLSSVNIGHEDMSNTSQSEIDTTYVIFAICTKSSFIIEPLNYMMILRQEVF